MELTDHAARRASASPDGAAIARSLSEPDGFAVVFDRHFAVVHRYLARRIGRVRADDLAAQTFLVAFEHRRRYRDELDTARPWLLGIATNLMRHDHRVELRRLATTARLHDRPRPEVTGPEPLGQLDARLAQALGALDSGQRDALLLHVWGELSYAEVAAALGIKIGTVRSRISRACALLRVTLADPSPPQPREEPR